MDVFTGCFLWEGVLPETVEQARGKCSEHVFSSGEVICKKDRFFDGIGMVAQGRAITSKYSVNGRRMPMSVLGEGELFGAVTLFGSSDRFETDICAGPDGCRVVYVGKELLVSLMQNDFCLCKNYMTYLCSRIRFLSRRVDSLFGSDGKSKLLSYLYGAADENGTVRLERNKANLAAKLSVSRATLYRAMDQLTEEGIIRREGNEIRLL